MTLTNGALADRCEQATGPDRELDVAIGLASKFYVAEPRYPGAEPMIGYIDEDGSRVEPGNGAQDSLVPRYTASLDAAMALVPEGWTHGYRWNELHRTARGLCEFFPVPPFAPHELITCESRKCATPALAMCAAALRARAIVDRNPKGGDGTAPCEA